MNVLALHGARERWTREALRWGGAGVCVLALHGAAFGYFWMRNEAITPAPAAAIMLELAPVPVAPVTESVELGAAAEQVEQASELAEPDEPEPVVEEKPVDEPPPTPEVVEKPLEELPQVAESPAPDIAVPLPPPAPPLPEELTPPEKKVEDKPPIEKPKTTPKPKKKERNDRPPSPVNSAAAKQDATPDQTVAAPTAGANSSNSVSPATWRSRLIAHINRNKPSSAKAEGTVYLNFAIDSQGRLLSSSLNRSSGSPALDEAALAMIRRSSPMPAPPANMGGRVSLTVPVRFTVR